MSAPKPFNLTGSPRQILTLWAVAVMVGIAGTEIETRLWLKQVSEFDSMLAITV